MAHGVLDQRLQQQRRQTRRVSGRVQVPDHAQPLAKADLLDRQVALGQLDLLGQRDGGAGIGQGHAEQFGQVFQHALGAGRVDPHQRDGAVQRVEQEMRADARLQLDQLRQGVRRALAVLAQLQPGQQHDRTAGSHRRHAAPAPGRGRLLEGQVQQREAQQRCDGAEQRQDAPLRGLGQPRPQALGRADDEQPGQHRKHRDHGAAGRQRQPLRAVARDNCGAQGQQQLHAEHRAQHQADVADVEGPGRVQQRW
mmetsp:Transcript_119912/g.333652  ORF Transcript_119912/g.333652 Transcript_119912/m.333652 type:complete len:253 (-) Transcript_119912:4411-5169(-)